MSAESGGLPYGQDAFGMISDDSGTDKGTDLTKDVNLAKDLMLSGSSTSMQQAEELSVRQEAVQESSVLKPTQADNMKVNEDASTSGSQGKEIAEIGDRAYPLRPWLLTPYLHPRGRGQHRYNREHTRARNVIERCFGVLKMRFRCLDHTGGFLPLAPGKVNKVFLVCCMLHNITRRQQLPLPDDIVVELEEEQNMVEDGETRSVDLHGQRRRDTLVQNYFA
ncbi:putative nuclease HARBI1 [Latimeria chalumnae]|uniref:putative nuclease HARBI1 n=1 Tax=Latimeria chalumnae TaxID=7897 RepID=UPI00313F2981